MLAESHPEDVDALVLHVGTNHLEAIADDIRHLERTLHQHQRLILEAKEVYSGGPVVVSGILPRYDSLVLSLRYPNMT